MVRSQASNCVAHRGFKPIGRGLPIEPPTTLEATSNQQVAYLWPLYLHELNREVARIVFIDVERRVPGHFRKRGVAAGDDRTSDRHRLDNRHPEALVS